MQPCSKQNQVNVTLIHSEVAKLSIVSVDRVIAREPSQHDWLCCFKGLLCEAAHLQVILLTGVQGVAAEVGLQLYVIFKGLIGRREGHRGEKLNRQTTKKNKKERREKVP